MAGTWQTLIPAYLLKDVDTECKTLLPMADALHMAEGLAGQEEEEAAIPPVLVEAEEKVREQVEKVNQSEAEGVPVWLHVYVLQDLTDEFHLPFINSALQRAGAGLFHAGVEVHGQEFSFGMRPYGTGVYTHEPRRNSHHAYRESILLGHTLLSPKDVRRLVRDMKKEWLGNSYRLISRNCIHFSGAFSQRLGAAGVPRWVYGLAMVAAQLVEGITASTDAFSRAVTLGDCNGRQLTAGSTLKL